jgi:orotate phosphoribosyltransferase
MATAHFRLVEHLRSHSLRTDGPFTLSSGKVADWYLDARQTTFSGEGARLVGEAIVEVVDPAAVAVGGMTMGADPMAVAAALVSGGRLNAFSIRKQEKAHGTGGRLVGPVHPGEAVAILEDTTTTGGALLEAVDVASEWGLEVLGAIALFDRSGGRVAELMKARRLPYLALVLPADLGVAP